MTEEDAAKSLEGAARAFLGEVPPETLEALARGASALRAFPLMKEALESIKAPGDETLDAIDDDRRSGSRVLPAPLTLKDLRRINAALDAARKVS
jgi:hypothetical protein